MTCLQFGPDSIRNASFFLESCINKESEKNYLLAWWNISLRKTASAISHFVMASETNISCRCQNSVQLKMLLICSQLLIIESCLLEPVESWSAYCSAPPLQVVYIAWRSGDLHIITGAEPFSSCCSFQASVLKQMAGKCWALGAFLAPHKWGGQMSEGWWDHSQCQLSLVSDN